MCAILSVSVFQVRSGYSLGSASRIERWLPSTEGFCSCFGGASYLLNLTKPLSERKYLYHIVLFTSIQTGVRLELLSGASCIQAAVWYVQPNKSSILVLVHHQEKAVKEQLKFEHPRVGEHRSRPLSNQAFRHRKSKSDIDITSWDDRRTM